MGRDGSEGEKMSDLVNRLYESDQASALTNQAARRIETLKLALSEISALRKEDHDKAGYIAVAALNKDKG